MNAINRPLGLRSAALDVSSILSKKLAVGSTHVVVDIPVGPLAKVTYALHLARAVHHERDDVRYLRGRTVTISGEEFWCSADGEIDGPERSRSWRVVPAAYSMILP